MRQKNSLNTLLFDLPKPRTAEKNREFRQLCLFIIFEILTYPSTLDDREVDESFCKLFIELINKGMKLSKTAFPGLILLTIHVRPEIRLLGLNLIESVAIDSQDIIPISFVMPAILNPIRAHLGLPTQDYKMYESLKIAQFDDLWLALVKIVRQVSPKLCGEFLDYVAPDGDKIMVSSFFYSITPSFHYQIELFIYITLSARCNYLKSDKFTEAKRFYFFLILDLFSSIKFYMRKNLKLY